MKLARTVLAGIAALGLAAAAAPALQAAPVSAVAVYVEGDVQIKRSGESAYAALAVNDLVYPGDAIKTGKASKLSLVTKGGAEVRLNENSSFEMSSKGKIREMLNLSVGQLWTRMLSRMAKVNVKTPSAVCAIRGTEAEIEQRSLMTVKVYEGHVDVQNSLGKQSLAAGQMTTVAGGNAAPAAAKKMGAGDVGNWQDGVKVSDYKKFQDMLEKSAATGGKLKATIKDKDGNLKEIQADLTKKK